MNVQAFINNVSFPKSLKELEYYADWQFDVETLMREKTVEWTVPKWAVPGDIVLFFHAKTAIQQIRRLETILKKDNDAGFVDRELLAEALQRARRLYNLYGGKIMAIGRVIAQPFYEPHPFMSEEEEMEQNIEFRTNRKIFAMVGDIQLLSCPVDIAEFSDFIFVSRQSAITPVVGSDFERLKEIIRARNPVPEYLLESRVIPLPLQKINGTNWLEVTREYRRRFPLEIQFRRFYVDYFLRVLGDQKKFFAECRCIREGKQTGFADNAIKLNGKWCFVEVKLNVQTEQHLQDQLKKYCEVECAALHEERILKQSELWQRTVLVLDTMHCYCYDERTDQLTQIETLDDIRTEAEIRNLRSRIIPMLQ